MWAKGYEIVARVQASTRPIPTEEELFAELPAIELDQFINTLIPNGYADESLSSRAYRRACIKKDRMWPMWIIDHLFFWQDEHCKAAYESEMERSQLPPSMRE